MNLLTNKIAQLLSLLSIFNNSIYAENITKSNQYIGVGQCNGYAVSSNDIQTWNRVNIPTSNYLYGIGFIQ